MAIRNIVKEGDPILGKKSRAVEQFNERLHELLDDMHDTLHDANGAGLAAVQVGVLRRVVLVDLHADKENSKIVELVNPEIIA